MLRRFTGLRFFAVTIFTSFGLLPQAYGLPSFARQTGQKCAACHVGGNWPQLTPWGRFFKLSGYSAGKSVFEKGQKNNDEAGGGKYVPAGLFGQVGLTWAAHPSDANGQPVIEHRGTPEAYEFTGEVATKLTNFSGIFYEYQLGNTFPGWKGAAGPVDLRAVHFFNFGNNELLVGVDSNNSPTVQDVWNTVPDWSFPYYSSPRAVGVPASPVIGSLGGQSGSVGAYALLNRQFYVEASFYHAATGFYRWMTPGNSFQAPGKNYLQGENPYWRAYWTKSRGAQSLMVGTLGMRARIFPDSTNPAGPVDVFTDYGFDTQYQYLGSTHKVTLRGSYIYEHQAWDASFALGGSDVPKGNLKALNLSATYAHDRAWAINGGYFLNNGNNNSALYAVTAPSGDSVTNSPNTSGYSIELDRQITQNIQLMAQYRGFLRYNGLQHNIDGIGRSASDNNTIWLSLFFAF